MFQHSRQTGIFAVIAAALLLTAACSSSATVSGSGSASGKTDSNSSPAATSKPPIEIGFLGLAGSPLDAPETGPAALVGEAYVNNALGGVHGRPIHLDVCNDQGTPESVTQCANQFVSSHVSAVLAYVTTNEAQLLTPLAAAHIPLVINAPNSVALTSPDAIGLSASVFQALLLPALYGQQHGLKSSDMILVNTGNSQAAINAMLPFYKKAGVAFSYQIASPGTPDLTPAVATAIAAHPSSLSVLGGTDFCASGLEAAHTLGYQGTVFLTNCVGPDLVKAVGPLVNGTISVSLGTALNLSASDQAKYQAALETYGKGMDPYATNVLRAFADVVLTASVLDRMPATSDYAPQAVLAAFKSLRNYHYFLDGGIPLTCDGSAIPVAPSVCSAKTYLVTYENEKLTGLGYEDFTSLLGA
jgi:branched-chain amino acid transport system substrate-binding protein